VHKEGPNNFYFSMHGIESMVILRKIKLDIYHTRIFVKCMQYIKGRVNYEGAGAYGRMTLKYILKN
jgi:hypothetical protein